MKSIWLQSLCEIYPLHSEETQGLLTTGYLHTAAFGGGLSVVWAPLSPAPWPLLRQWWQAPHAVPSLSPGACLDRQQLGVTTHMDWASPAGKSAIRVGSTSFSEGLPDKSPAVAPGDYSDTFSSSVISPVALHHAWGVSEWPCRLVNSTLLKEFTLVKTLSESLNQTV